MLQGAKSEPEAVERHRSNLQRSLGLLAHAAWIPLRTVRGSTWVVRTAPESLELRTIRGAALYLTAAQNFVVDHHNRTMIAGAPFTGYKARTTGYAYSVGMAPDPDAAFLAWHWHPPDPLYTHSHVYVKDEVLGNVGKLHLPTSRVFFEQVVGFLIVGLEVEPLDPDWRTTLGDVAKGVRAAATWRGDRP